MTHDRIVDWLLPQVPPTGKQIAVPMLGVINIRGDRLYHGMSLHHFPFHSLLLQLPASAQPHCHCAEHIWWDQSTVLLQIGIIPSHVPWPLSPHSAEPTPEGVAGQWQRKKLRLPIAPGDSSAKLLIDETDGVSNQMFGEEWGVMNA